MARAVIDNQQLIGLEPQAQPQSTFVQPAPSPLHDVARALGGLSKDLGGFLQGFDDKEAAQEQALKAQRDFAKNRVGYAEGVRQGLIGPAQNKHYVNAYKEAEGNTAGLDFQASALPLFEQSGVKNSEDPKALSTWQQQVIKDRFKTEDPYVIKGYLPHINSFINTTTEAWIKGRNAAVATGSLNTHVAAGIKAAFAPTLSGGAYDWNAAFGERDKYAKEGGNADEYDKFLIEGAAIQAQSGVNGDEKALSLFSQKVPGKDYTYGETTEGRKVFEATKDKLRTMQNAEEASAYTRHQREDKDASDKATTGIMEVLAGNPSAEVPEDLIAQAARARPTIKAEVAGWRKQMAEGNPSDPEELKRVTTEIINGRGIQAVTDAMGRKAFGNAEDMQKLYNFAKSSESAKEVIKDVRGLNSYRQTLDAIKAQTTATSDLMNPFSGLTEEGAEAQYDFERSVTQWLIKNPTASLSEQEEFIGKQAAAITKRIQPGGFGEPGSYNRDAQSFDFQNPRGGPGAAKEPEAAPAAPTPAAPAAEPSQRAPVVGGKGIPATPQPQAADDDTSLELYGSMNPQQKQAVKAVAAATKKPLIEVLRGMATHSGVKKMSFGGDDAGSALDGPGSLIRASYTTDDAAKTVNAALGTNFSADDMQGASDAFTSATGIDLSPEAFAQSKGRDVASLPAGLRNNNPGNIKYLPNSTLGRMTGPSKNTDQGSPQAVYASPQEGTAAAARLLLRKFAGGRQTIRQVIASEGGWSGGNQAAAEHIAEYAGLNPDEPINLRDPSTLSRVMRAVFKQEQGDDNALIDDKTIMAGAQEALTTGKVRTASLDGSYGLGGTSSPETREVLYSVLSKDKGREHVDNMKPELADGLAAMVQNMPPEIRKGFGIYSGFRSIERQRELWEASDKTGHTVARPGGSQHNHGNAADLSYNGQRLDKAPRAVIQWIHLNAPRFRLRFPMSYEAWHVESADARRPKKPSGPRQMA